METEKLSNCPQCGQTVDRESAFCTNCAFPLNDDSPETVEAKVVSRDTICPNCSNHNPKDALFCNSCGNLFETQSTAGNTVRFNLTPPPPPPVDLQSSIPPSPPADFQNSFPPPPVQNQTFPATSPDIFVPPVSSGANPVQAPPSQKNLIISLISVGVILVSLIAIFSSINSSDTSTTAKATPTPANSATPDKSNPYSSIIGKFGKVMENDLKIRSYASPSAPQIGVLYMNTKIKILDAKNGETGTLWYQVKVIEYGCSRDPGLGCGKDNPNDAEEGWAYSGYVSLDN